MCVFVKNNNMFFSKRDTLFFFNLAATCTFLVVAIHHPDIFNFAKSFAVATEPNFLYINMKPFTVIPPL